MGAIERVGVFGVGVIGGGVAEVCARAGLTVVGVDVDEAALAAGLGALDRSLARAVSRRKLGAKEAAAARTRIRGTVDRDALRDVDLVVEAVPEDRALKLEVHEALGRAVRPEAIFATTTSSLSVTELAASSERPERFIGLHFFQPVPVMKLVEVVRGFRTSDETYRTACDLLARIGKQPIGARDRSGFVVHRLLIPFLLEAVEILETGYATRDDIDKGMMLGCGHPMGPLKLLDYVGLDYALEVANALYEEYNDERFRPPALVRQMVAAGLLGRKTGRGFYDWPEAR